MTDEEWRQGLVWVLLAWVGFCAAACAYAYFWGRRMERKSAQLKDGR